MTVEEIINVANAIAPKQNYRAQDQPAVPLIGALVALAQQQGISSAQFETTITVTGDSSSSPATFFIPSSGSTTLGGGFYIITCLAEVTGSTIPGGSAVLSDFTITWSENGSSSTTGIGTTPLSVNAVTAGGAYLPPVIVDFGQPVQWSYTVSGFTTGTCTLKLLVNLIRLA